MSDPYEHAYDQVLGVARNEIDPLSAWCAEWAPRRSGGRAGRKQAIDVILSAKSDLERRGMVVAMMSLCAEHSLDHADDRRARADAGFFGYQSPAGTVLRALGRLRLRWTPEEARALAAYASQRGARRKLAGLDLYTIASRALEQLDDEDLRASTKELIWLRRAANSTWATGAETERRAAVQRLKRLVWRVQAGNRERIPDYALDWRDDFGNAARSAVLDVAPEADCAVALEVLGLYGTASQPPASWRRLVEEVGLEDRIAPVAQAVLETVLRLEDNPEVIDPETNPMFLAPESEGLARAAVWAVSLTPRESRADLLRSVAIKCAARSSVPGPRAQRAPGIAMSAISALGSLADTPASDSARAALAGIAETISHKSIQRAVDQHLEAFAT